MVQSGAYSSLFTASRAMESDCEEKKMLSKIFQRMKSIEASKKAEKKKAERVVSRMNSFGSAATLSFKDQADLLAEMNKTVRGQSFSLPSTRSRKTDKRASTLSVSFRRSRTDSCDSDVALGKEKSTQQPPKGQRFQKLKSLAGLRRARYSQA